MPVGKRIRVGPSRDYHFVNKLEMNRNWVGPSRDCHVGKRIRVGPSRDSHFVNKLEVCWKLASLRFRADGELRNLKLTNEIELNEQTNRRSESFETESNL